MSPLYVSPEKIWLRASIQVTAQSQQVFTKPGSSVSAEESFHIQRCISVIYVFVGIYANALMALLPTAKISFFF